MWRNEARSIVVGLLMLESLSRDVDAVAGAWDRGTAERLEAPGSASRWGLVRADSHIATAPSLGPARVRIAVVGLVSTYQDTGTSCNPRTGRTPPNLIAPQSRSRRVQFRIS